MFTCHGFAGWPRGRRARPPGFVAPPHGLSVSQFHKITIDRPDGTSVHYGEPHLRGFYADVTDTRSFDIAPSTSVKTGNSRVPLPVDSGRRNARGGDIDSVRRRSVDSRKYGTRRLLRSRNSGRPSAHRLPYTTRKTPYCVVRPPHIVKVRGAESPRHVKDLTIVGSVWFFAAITGGRRSSSVQLCLLTASFHQRQINRPGKSVQVARIAAYSTVSCSSLIHTLILLSLSMPQAPSY